MILIAIVHDPLRGSRYKVIPTPVITYLRLGFNNKELISRHAAFLDTSKIDPRQIPLKFLNRDDQSTFLVTFIENLEPRITKAGHNVGLKMRPNS